VGFEWIYPPNSDWVLDSATAINDQGHIVVYGHTNGGKSVHAFLLIPND
jgi:probable HAF family extracellular repeat protein